MVLSHVQSDTPMAIVRASAWSNSLARMGVHLPLFVVHDIGHLLQMVRNRPAETLASDDLHQYMALPFLRGLLPESVLEPIRLHVDAKRYLCFVEPSYLRVLSAESIRSLKMQGGAFNGDQARRFLTEPFAAQAIRLRRCDDLAKVPRKATRSLEHFLSLTATVSC